MATIVSYAKAAIDALITGAKARANHTGTQSADTLTDGTTNKAFTATERTKLTGVATAATANSTDATLLARTNHTGTQSADTLTDGTTNKAFLATERTKLTGIATGATANSADATLLARANHTGTQAASTITGLATVAASGAYADLSGKPDLTLKADSRAPYLGPVGTRCRIPSGSVATSIYKQMMTWSRHVAVDDISALSLLYTAIVGTGEVSTSAGPGTVSASVEYPMGTFTRVTFGSSSTGTIPANDHLVSDMTTLPTRIPAGATFYVGTWVNWTGTNSPVMMDSTNGFPFATNRETVQASTTTITDSTLTGTRAAAAGVNPRDSYRPSAILGMTARPTFALTGDSRTRAALAWDLNADLYGYQGLTESVLGGRYGYINLGVGTDSYTNVLSGTGNNYIKRGELAAYCTHILDDYGINSVWTDATATHQANVASFRAKFPGKVFFKTTLIPQLTAGSTQIAADGSDQVVFNAANIQRWIDNNNWVRQGAGGVIDGYIELEDLVTLKRDSSKFKPAERVVADAAMTSGSNVLTSATAAFTSSDVGKHIHILGAGAAGAALRGQIGAVTNATTVTILNTNQTSSVLNASTTVSGVSAGIGVLASDNTHQTRQLEALIRTSTAVRALAMVK